MRVRSTPRPAPAPDGLLMLDAAGVIRHASGPLETAVGAPLAGQSLADRFRRHDELPLTEALDRAAAGATVHLTGVLAFADGGRPVQMVLDSSGIADVPFVASVRDGAEMERVAEVMATQERLATLGLATASGAHSINNALASMTSVLALLEHPGLSATDQATYRRQLSRETARATEMVTRLLSLARAGDNGYDVFAIDDAIADALALTAGPCATHHVTVRHTADVVGSRQVVGRRAQLEQVIVQLVTNAVEAMAARPLHLPRELTLHLTATADDRLLLAVHDTGGGVATAHEARVFERFYTTKPNQSGVGLHTARLMAQQNLAQLTLENRPGDGATFTLACLRAAADAAQTVRGSGTTMLAPTVARGVPVQPVQPVLGAGAAGGNLTPRASTPPAVTPGAAASSDADAMRQLLGRTVLVVDDETVYRSATARMLNLYQPDLVIEAATADEALEAIRESGELIDAILLDMRLPDRTGREVYDEIQATMPDLASRVVFVMGDRVEGDMLSFLRSSGARYLTKPYRPMELVRTLGEVLAAAPARA